METKKLSYYLFKVSISLICVLVLFGLMDVYSALAQMPQKPPTIIVEFTEPPTPMTITDLTGNEIGYGEQVGHLRCKNNCSQKTHLSFISPAANTTEYEYKFATNQATDIEERRVVVGGTGTISNDGQKERFSFTATIVDNLDGTLWVKYEASRTDAAFIIPSSPGLMRIQ